MKRRTCKFQNNLSRSQRGFTLVELMVAVAIVGVLVQMAIPSFNKFKILASRSEAKVQLNNIYTLQKTYHAENGFYGELDLYGDRKTSGAEECLTPSAPSGVTADVKNHIGFRAKDPCTLRYIYLSDVNIDQYNLTFPNRDVGFTAYAATLDADLYGVQLGRGFGFSTDNCSVYGSQGMREVMVMNQDREAGFTGEGHYREINQPELIADADATKQCN